MINNDKYCNKIIILRLKILACITVIKKFLILWAITAYTNFWHLTHYVQSFPSFRAPIWRNKFNRRARLLAQRLWCITICITFVTEAYKQSFLSAKCCALGSSIDSIAGAVPLSCSSFFVFWMFLFHSTLSVILLDRWITASQLFPHRHSSNIFFRASSTHEVRISSFCRHPTYRFSFVQVFQVAPHFVFRIPKKYVKLDGNGVT